MNDSRAAADIVAVMGATGAGKSTAIRIKLAADRAPRRLIWDPAGDYSDCGQVVTDAKQFGALVLAASHAGPLRLVYRPPFDVEKERAHFGQFCTLAYAAGDVLVVADELASVMTATWAPAGWRRLVRLGRKRGCRIVAASQRPAGIEKDFWDMATVIRSGWVRGASADTMADALMVDRSEVMALAPLHFIQRSIYEPVIQWGRIEWRAGEPLEIPMQVKKLVPDAPA